MQLSLPQKVRWAGSLCLMEPIYDRMPVILDSDQWALWLSQKKHQADKLFSLRSHNFDYDKLIPAQSIFAIVFRNVGNLILNFPCSRDISVYVEVERVDCELMYF